ncbi:N-acetylglucosamine kinase [Nigerium massiliense]|uniref:N-acetylglucosamine kinase n=1 Tax=Nigerium massiliense TaxID=1522317 RepID=UPI00058F17C1|nr:BadF/BadG/BcrA/BcrD ATPase family protein [Nigerium massiliense]
MESFIALDGGQSTSKIRAVGAHGVLEATFPGVRTDRPLPPQWIQIIESFLADHPQVQASSLAVGSSGLGRETAHDLAPALSKLGFTEIALAHDSVTCYLGSLAHNEGVMVAAGTGTICLGVGPLGFARVDGWGWIMGDAGSAYWIGRTALEAAMRGHDGRRQLTALTDMVADEFTDLEHAYLELQADPNKVARIAALAGEVNRLADTDRVARIIVDKAAAHLSEAALAAIRRVGLSGPSVPRVAVLGRVFDSERIHRQFVDFLRLQWPDFALAPCVGDILDGTAALLGLDTHHPLFTQVSYAHRASKAPSAAS